MSDVRCQLQSFKGRALPHDREDNHYGPPLFADIISKEACLRILI